MRYIVCLDPGHGPDTVNGSPDGVYKEREFTWDLYLRLRRQLEGQGIQVVGTRTEGEKPSLTHRAQVSNAAGADLLISIHTNAAGSGWSSPSGLTIYTSAPGVDAPRNIAARDILERMRQDGIKIWGTGLAHEGFTVLVKATAPAVLIEYGFHTNRGDVTLLLDPAYREKLAVATAQGVCDFFGLPWRDEDCEEGCLECCAALPAPWAAEAWEKATALGVMDGTDPQGTVTREMLSVVLDRCGLLDPAPERLVVEVRPAGAARRRKIKKFVINGENTRACFEKMK